MFFKLSCKTKKGTWQNSQLQMQKSQYYYLLVTTQNTHTHTHTHTQMGHSPENWSKLWQRVKIQSVIFLILWFGNESLTSLICVHMHKYDINWLSNSNLEAKSHLLWETVFRLVIELKDSTTLVLIVTDVFWDWDIPLLLTGIVPVWEITVMTLSNFSSTYIGYITYKECYAFSQCKCAICQLYKSNKTPQCNLIFII